MRNARIGLVLLPLLFAMLFSLVASAAPPPLSPSLSQGQGRFGVVEAYAAPTLAQASGATWERLFFWWNKIQPASSQEWKTDQIISDQQIDAELQRGMTLVGLLGNPPQWATRNGSVPLNLSGNIADSQNYWAGFVKGMVKRYAGRIDNWIIWNEPDIDPGNYWSTWAGSEEEYYQLLKSSYLAAKSVNPGAQIIFGGTTYWSDALKGRKLFLERVLERAVLDPTAKDNNYYFDAVDLHIYSKSHDMYDIPLTYRDVMRRYGIDKPIWIGEANVVPWNDPVAPMPPGGFRATMDEQASFAVQGLALAMAAGVQRIGFFKMTDGILTDGEAYGLARNDGTTRPAYAAFQTAARLFSAFPQAQYDEELGVDRVIMTSGDRRVTVLWNPYPKPKTVKIRAIGINATQHDKSGKATTMKIPLAIGQNFYSFDLASATANVADLHPELYIIGGDPVILVEEGIGQPIRLSPTEVFYPITGYSIGGGFLDFFNQWGGVAMFGYPRSQEVKEGGRAVQYFQKARFEYFPDLVGTPYQVQLGLLQLDLSRGKTFPIVEPFDSSSDRVYYSPTGHSVQGGFLKFFQQHGGVDVLGYPLSEESIEGGLRVQYFQRTRLEYHVSGGAQGNLDIGNVGDEYLAARAPKPPAGS
ncbi:MAG: hypothetical protein Q8R28_14495 [Dehalococcoidia bacterium]|nr:hypothetical protein [Dehalococcoidia bacterium]